LTRLFKLSIAVLIIHLCTMGPIFSYGQEPVQSQMKPAAAGSDHHTQTKAIEQLSTEERRSVDARLAQGLTHFYDGNFEGALKVFSELQRIVSNDRLDYLSARSQMGIGNGAVANSMLTDLLDQNPEHDEARVALIKWYADSGDVAAIAEQMQYLEDGSLEDDYRVLLDQFKRRIAQRSKDARHYLSISQGLLWDSNINAAPDKSEITAPDGTVFYLDEDSRAISDWASTTYLYGWYRYDPASLASLYWDTSASLYHLHYFEHDEYDWTDLRISTGPVLSKSSFYLSLPAGYRKSFEHGNAYSDDIFFQPVFKYTLNHRWAIKSAFYYGDRSHADQANDVLNKVIRRVDLQPILSIHKTSISGGVGWFSASARDSFYNYHGVEAYLYARHGWSDRTSMSLGYTHRQTYYQGIYTGWFNKRNDVSNSLYASMTHTMGKHVSLVASIGWSDNQSNTELFEYQRWTSGLNITFKF